MVGRPDDDDGRGTNCNLPPRPRLRTDLRGWYGGKRALQQYDVGSGDGGNNEPTQSPPRGAAATSFEFVDSFFSVSFFSFFLSLRNLIHFHSGGKRLGDRSGVGGTQGVNGSIFRKSVCVCAAPSLSMKSSDLRIIHRSDFLFFRLLSTSVLLY